MDKIKVSQDVLRTYLEEHHFINAALAKKMGVSEGIVSACFNHKLNRHGKPLSFSRKNIELLNQALQQIAEDLSGCKLKASDEDSDSKRFINDDPAVMESLRRIGEYIRLKGLTDKVLGWKYKKCLNNISLNGPKPHVHISKEDAMRLSTAIMAMASTLAGWEVVSNDDSDTAKPSDNKEGSRTRMEQSFESKAQPWDDTTIDLVHRLQIFKQQHPDGILFFRFNGGYITAQEDAATIHRLRPDIEPYTDHASGRTTAFMYEDAFSQVLPCIIAEGRRVAITDMYA